MNGKLNKGLILVNAYSRRESSLNQSRRLKEEFGKSGIAIDIKNNDYFAASIDGNGNIKTDFDYDFCIYLDKDKYISQMLERAGVRVFNSHFSIQACDDKMTTSVLLSNSGIPMPQTLAGLLCYDRDESLNGRALDEVERRLGYPLIVKTCYGSLGKGVYKADNREQLNGIAEELKCKPHLFQKFIKSSCGRDIRVIVIGGKYVAAMVRQSDSDFRSNLSLGGSGKAIDVPEEVVEMCERAAAILKLDYCGIDVLFGEGKYYLCEVNSNAFFGGIESVTGVNIAKKYADYIIDKVYKNSATE